MALGTPVIVLCAPASPAKIATVNARLHAPRAIQLTNMLGAGNVISGCRPWPMKVAFWRDEEAPVRASRQGWQAGRARPDCPDTSPHFLRSAPPLRLRESSA